MTLDERLRELCMCGEVVADQGETGLQCIYCEARAERDRLKTTLEQIIQSTAEPDNDPKPRWTLVAIHQISIAALMEAKV